MLVAPPLVAFGDAAGVWRTLVAHYERKTLANKAHIRSMLHKSRMNDDEPFDVYKARIMHLAASLKSMSETVEEGELATVLLEGLPRSYRGVRQALQVQEHLSLNSISAHLRDHQERSKYEAVKDEEVEEVEQAFSALGMRRGGAGGKFGGGGAGGAAQRGSGRGQERRTYPSHGKSVSFDNNDESSYRCRLCRQVGHWESFCDRRRRSGNACFRCGSTDHQMRDCRGNAGGRRGDDRVEHAMTSVHWEDESDIQF